MKILPDAVRREARRILSQGRKVLLRWRLGEHWDQEGRFAHRVYPDYETYVFHQRTKLDAARAQSIAGHDRRFHGALVERLAALPFPLNGARVLCLAARQGSEVRAFIDRGAFAVGIDLNPGRKNRYVMVGDFHDLQFADDSVDVVFTNSLDHAFDIHRILREVRRVLTGDGLFIAEVNRVDEGGAPRGFYESLSWSSVAEIERAIEGAGFRLERRSDFQVPWDGEQLVFRRTSAERDDEGGDEGPGEGAVGGEAGRGAPS